MSLSERLRAFRRQAVVLMMACLLAGCGWHMRGSSPLPAVMESVYITGQQQHGPLVDAFTEALRARGINVVYRPSLSTAQINIIDHDIDRQVQSVDAAGNVLEYEISQSLRFSITDRDQQLLLDEQTVRVSRDYLFTSTGVLGRAREEAVIHDDLRRNLVELAMLRIVSLAR